MQTTMNGPIFSNDAMAGLRAPVVDFFGDGSDGGQPRSIDIRVMRG